MAQWDLLEISFPNFCQVQLEDAFRSRSWRWFCVMVRGILSADTPLARHFAPKDEPTN